MNHLIPHIFLEYYSNIEYSTGKFFILSIYSTMEHDRLCRAENHLSTDFRQKISLNIIHITGNWISDILYFHHCRYFIQLPPEVEYTSDYQKKFQHKSRSNEDCEKSRICGKISWKTGDEIDLRSESVLRNHFSLEIFHGKGVKYWFDFFGVPWPRSLDQHDPRFQYNTTNFSKSMIFVNDTSIMLSMGNDDLFQIDLATRTLLLNEKIMLDVVVGRDILSNLRHFIIGYDISFRFL